MVTCDAAVIDDMEANRQKLSCQSKWKMDLQVKDQTTKVVFPVVNIAPTICASKAGSDCQVRGAARRAY